MKRTLCSATLARGALNLLVVGGLCVPLFAFDPTKYPPATTPIPVIFDTDMGNDCDDAGALALLNVFSDRGVCKIVAAVIDDANTYAAGCIDAICVYYKRPNIPIGIVKNGPSTSANAGYTQTVTQQFPNSWANRLNQIPDAVTVYRQALAQQADTSVVVVNTGFKTILAQLLQSGADTISPLSGKDLVAKKVRLWVDMGGQYPSGDEFNFYNDAASTRYAVENWPTPIVFSGFEIGSPILSGSTLSSKTPAGNPVRKCYEIYVGVGGARSSWDVTAALFACCGQGQFWTVHTGGYDSIAANGSNAWVDQSQAGRDQSYLVAKMSNSGVSQVLDSLMVVPPRTDTTTSVAVRSIGRTPASLRLLTASRRLSIELEPGFSAKPSIELFRPNGYLVARKGSQTMAGGGWYEIDLSDIGTGTFCARITAAGGMVATKNITIP